jgi:hypothetical protein
LLADITTVECDQCKESIQVKDVVITSQYFTVNRKEFLNQTFRFQRLLRDVEKDLLSMADDNVASTRSIENLEQLHSSLHELLDGARDSYRMEIPRDLYVEVTALSRVFRGKLLNLSADGCSIEFEMCDVLPRKKTEIVMEFFFSGLSELLKTKAEVMWTNGQSRDNGPSRATIGVAFISMDEHTRKCIWDYIHDNAPDSYQQVSR